MDVFNEAPNAETSICRSIFHVTRVLFRKIPSAAPVNLAAFPFSLKGDAHDVITR
jgi:hypothetical protein